MNLPLKHNIRYAQHFAKMNSILNLIKTVLNFWFIFFYFFNISVKNCFLSFLYLNCCELFEVFNPRVNKAIIIILQ